MPRMPSKVATQGVPEWDASVDRIRDLIDTMRAARNTLDRHVGDTKRALEDLMRKAHRAGMDDVSNGLYRVIRGMDDGLRLTSLRNGLDHVDGEYRRAVDTPFARVAGRGLELPEVFQAIFGGGSSAKAFRALVTHMKDKWYRAPADVPADARAMADAAMPTVQAIRTSQALKTLIGENPGWVDLRMSESDPVRFAAFLGAGGIRDLKRLLEFHLKGKVPTPTLSGEAKRFLREWVDTNARAMPRPVGQTAMELKPYRPDGTQILYRGIRFTDVGELVEFTRTYGEGRPFPFSSSRYTAWSKDIRIAERFGRYRAATDQNDAMMGWFSMARSQKDYHGQGGYVIGARVKPEQCLVDIGKTGIGGQHGNEDEVIVLPNQALVCKVYKVFGDVVREVEDFRGSDGGKQTPEEFLRYIGLHTTLTGVDGDVATFVYRPYGPFEAGGSAPRGDDLKTPRGADGAAVLGRFRANLYDAEWIDDHRVRFRPMADLSTRLAAAWGDTLR